MSTSRRTVMLGGAAAVAAVAIAANKPGDKGGPYPAYFEQLNRTLKNHQMDRPVLVIDLDRLDRNIDRVVKSASTAPASASKTVAKLPAITAAAWYRRGSPGTTTGRAPSRSAWCGGSSGDEQ